MDELRKRRIVTCRKFIIKIKKLIEYNDDKPHLFVNQHRMLQQKITEE